MSRVSRLALDWQVAAILLSAGTETAQRPALREGGSFLSCLLPFTYGIVEVMKVSTHQLTRWRRLLLIRDSMEISARTVNGEERPVRSPMCPMCNNPYPSWRLQAHHIRPISLYPQLALELSNGIMLCLQCHMGITHSGNSFKDITELHHWRFMRPAFDRYVRLAPQREFNGLNQHRLR